MTLRILYLFSAIVIFTSCNDDESRTCTTCTSDLTAAFEVCRESDGTASVNGENTDTDFDLYLDGLAEAGATCDN